MNLLLTILLIFFTAIAFGTERPLDYYILDGQKLHWQDPQKTNRYYWDMDGNGAIDRMDVMLENGRDYYSKLHRSKGYLSKQRVRYEDKAITHEFQVKEGSGWKTVRSKRISQIDKSSYEYHVWPGDMTGKTLFSEILEKQSLWAEDSPICLVKESKETLNFSGVSDVLNSFSSTYIIDQSCLDQCEELNSKFKLGLNTKTQGACKFLFDQLATNAFDKSMSCLVKENKVNTEIGHDLGHRILNGLIYSGEISESNEKRYIKLKCTKNKSYHGKVSGIFSGEQKEISIDFSDFSYVDGAGLDSQFNLAFGHELYHIAGYYHNANEIDVSYACNECCNSNNEIACKVCNQSDKLQMEPADYLLSLIVYQNYLSPKYSLKYYRLALEKLHALVQDDQTFLNLDDELPMKRGKLIEILYNHLIIHIRNPVDNRGKDKLRYSDMLAEVMAKLNCYDVGRMPSDERTEQDRYGCEIMYLARSIPSSYCYNKGPGQSCVQAIKTRYMRRKQVDRTGIPLPEDFFTLGNSI